MIKLQIISLFIIIFLINETKNDCDKYIPILKDNTCQNIYCDEAQFQNGECIISNPIIRTQWLNNIICTKKEYTLNILSIQMPNKDIIFVNSIYTDNIETFADPLIYGLKSSGENYFNHKFSSVIINSDFLNGVGLNIDNNQYFLFCEISECKLFDLENNNIYTRPYYELLQNNEEISSLTNIFTIINLDNKNKILFTCLTSSEIYLSIINLTSKDLSSFEKIHKANGQDRIQINQSFTSFKCLITIKKYIECLYLYNQQYLVAIYDDSLNYLNNIFLQNVQFENTFHNPINAIHLKKEISAFAYYINNVNIYSPLHVKINELYCNEGIYYFKEIIPEITVSIDNYNYIRNVPFRMNKESMIKIRDNHFAYAYIHSDAIIILILFDLYGDNDENLLVRYHKINLILYNFIDVNIIHLFMFNSFLGLGFIGAKEDDNNDYSYFLIFGNSAKNIDNLSLDIYKENKGFLLELKNFYSDIDNNLFGYKFSIKISAFSDGLKGIRFFSINKNNEITINELLSKEDSILFDFTGINIQIGKEYIIEISSITYEPEYNVLIELYDKVEKYGEDYKNYYESKIIDEKKINVKLKFGCHESITSCNYPNLTTKTIENDSYNIVYFSDFIYKQEENNLLKTYLNINNYDANIYCKNDIININQYNFMNKCINECPSDYVSDSSNNCIFICQNENQYIFNSKCYDECPEKTIQDLSTNNQKICKCKNLYNIDENNNNICLISSSFLCDDNHPILNENKNECINYKVKYGKEHYFECPKSTCISEKYKTSTICEQKTSDMKILNKVCFNNYSSLINKLELMAKNNIKLNDRDGVILNVYSYNNYSKNFDDFMNNNLQTTTIDLRECLELFKSKNNLDDETDIFIVLVETSTIYSNETINRFDFELYFDNLTQIINLDICKDINMKVYSPIKNSKLLDLDLGYYFYEQGEYNIFNKNDKFYKDICSKANIDNNDIILNDRYIDMYPHEVQICPKDCECLGINYTTSTFICDCQIKLNEDDYYEYELMTKDEIVKYFHNFRNLIEYFNDFFNYKIIKCFKLLLDLDNYVKNIGIYFGIFFFICSFIFFVIFKRKGYKSIRIIFHNNLKGIIKVKEKEKENNKKESGKKLIKIQIAKNNYENSIPIGKNKMDSNNFIISPKSNKKKKNTKHPKIIDIKYSSINKISNYNDTNINNNNNFKQNNIEENGFSPHKMNKIKEELSDELNNNEINELSYYIARYKDKRNIFKIFLSMFWIKIELIKIIFNPEQYSSRYLLFNIYLLNAFINLLMNCILYNDYAISQKYHNNGTLEFITSFVISLFSNILTSIVFYCINILANYHIIIENIIKEIKNEDEYIHLISRLFKLIGFKTYILLIFETLFGLFMTYYLFIFCVLYSNTIKSFLLNSLLSQVNSIIYSFCLCLLISVLRKISLIFGVKRLYIISNYCNEHF